MVRKAIMARFAVVVLIALLVSGCGAKDLVSATRLDKGDIYIRDKYGNQVKVPNPSELLEALKDAKKIPVPGTEDSSGNYYVIFNDESTLYYDDVGKHLVYTGANQKKTAYQADIDHLLAAISGLPPRVVTGVDLDPGVSKDFPALSRTDEPWGLSFGTDKGRIVMVSAGAQPSAGYEVGLEKASFGQDGTLVLTVRLSPPAGPADDVVTYPYVELLVPGDAELDLRLVTASSAGDKTLHVGLTSVGGSQTIIPMRPERGSLVMERATVTGFVKTGSSPARVDIAVEDGHIVLGSAVAQVSAASPGWGFFTADMDLLMATSPYGTVVLRAQVDGETREITVPVSFSGK